MSACYTVQDDRQRRGWLDQLEENDRLRQIYLTQMREEDKMRRLNEVCTVPQVIVVTHARVSHGI